MPSPLRTVRSVVGRLGRSDEALGLLVAVGGIGGGLVCAFLGWEIGALVLVLVSVLAELVFEPRSPNGELALRQASVGMPMRWMLRVVVVLVAAEHVHDVWAVRTFALVAIGLTVVLCARALHFEYRRVGPLKPMRTRNIASNPHINVAPPAQIEAVVLAQLLTLVPVAVHAPWWLILLLGMLGAGILATVTIPAVRASLSMRRAKRQTGSTGPLRQVQKFLDEYQPEVVVHLSGPETAGYQINTWLESLEFLDRRVFIVLRDGPLFGKLASTTIPALELRDPGELLMLDFSSVRIALYPCNTGNNIHLLRLPNIMSAFIGHGDSDKSASNNPFSRAYDELWVAGEAGADRYRRSDLGVHDDQYRFVGRPQVHAIGRAPELGEESTPTVLYAPTWEGVNLDQEYSSVSAVGEHIVAGLLAAEPAVRVVFKAHPFTGQRDAKYRAVLARIAAMIDDAAARTGIDHRVVKGGSINEWFNRSTALITDVSSVVSDFLSSEKPYAVFNHTDLDDLTFQAEYPSTGAATIIGRDGHGIGEFAALVTGAAPDADAVQRAHLATYLLGPPEQRSLQAFAASIEGLIGRSETERAQYRDGTSTAEIMVTEE